MRFMPDEETVCLVSRAITLGSGLAWPAEALELKMVAVTWPVSFAFAAFCSSHCSYLGRTKYS